MDIERILAEINVWRDKVRFSDSCCDKPEDRLYHAADKTWWKREGMEWKRSEPPEGWVKKGD